MKLRISGNGLRFRMGRSEVERLAREGMITDRIAWAGGRMLSFGIVSSTGGGISCGFDGSAIHVEVPKETLEVWASGEEVGVYGESAGVKVAIEKDFACKSEPSEDAYPNPNECV